MIRVCITVFNISNLLELQVELWRKYLDCEIVVLDNSTDLGVSKEVRALCKHLNVDFVKTGVCEADSSRSHGWACNVAYAMYGDCDILVLVDHDIFPYKPVDMGFFDGQIMAGIQQIRKQYIYLWPGLIFIRPEIGDIDFMPTKIHGTHIDTGAGTWQYINNGVPVKYLSEVHQEHDGGIYAVIEDCFMHFINGSNWKQEDNHNGRIDGLINILKAKLE